MSNPIPLNGMFATPNSIEDLTAMLESVGTPEEKRMAWFGASLALNLAHMLHEKSLADVA
jgi:hypothetical protein